jgi:hypothetical protein
MADPEIQALARRFKAGGRSAQLDLGYRHDAGRVRKYPALAHAAHRRRSAAEGGDLRIHLPAGKATERHHRPAPPSGGADEPEFGTCRRRLAPLAPSG